MHLCKSKTGTPCDIPFAYQGYHYDTCINLDSGGVPWCYTDVTNKTWEACSNTSCTEMNGMMKFIVQCSQF